MKTQVVLPFVRATKGTVVYGVPNLKSVAVGQVYINKDGLTKIDGDWPTEVTITIEAGDTTEARQS